MSSSTIGIAVSPNSKPSSGGKGGGRTRFEFSAGGIVRDGDQLLMVLVQNLEGQQIWTFPKGHIEKDEKAPETAVREVEEETGYRCEIVQPLEQVRYWFKRDNQLTRKTVTWYLMKPLEKTGTHDPEEIMDTRWVPLEEARRIVKYRSDKKLLEKINA